MNEVVILNESAPISHSRYVGPYAVAKKLRDKGVKTVIFDFFTRDYCPFWETIEKLVTKDTKYLCITNTFLFDHRELRQEQKLHGQLIKNNPNGPKRKTQINYLKFDKFLDKMLDNKEKGKPQSRDNIEEYVNGILNLFWSDADHINEWFSRIRKISPDIKFIMGGTRTTEVYQLARMMKVDQYKLKDWIDCWVLGYADDAFCDLIQNYDEVIKDVDDVKGFKFLNVSKFAKKWPKYQIPISPFCDEDVLSDKEMVPLETSRGCAFNCKFCHFEKGFSHKLCKQDLHNQLTYYYEKYGIKKYHLTTDCFNDNYKHVLDFYDVVQKLPYKPIFASYARVDLCNRYPEVPRLMAESGFKVLQVGIESFNHDVAKAAGRGLPAQKIIDLLHEWKQYEITMTGNFIIGLPGETVESQLKTFEWAATQRLITPVFRTLHVYPYFQDIANVMGYPHYSLDPKKYGFDRFEFNPFMYWQHSTMDIYQARKLEKIWMDEYHPRLAPDLQVGAQTLRDDITYAERSQAVKSKTVKDYWKRLVEFNSAVS